MSRKKTFAKALPARFGLRNIKDPPPLPEAIMSLVTPFQHFKRQVSWSLAQDLFPTL